MNKTIKTIEALSSEENPLISEGTQRIFQSTQTGKWKLYKDGKLTTEVSYKEVNMDSYSDGKQEWYDYMDQIKAVTVGSNWLSVGGAAFKNAANLKRVKLSDNTKTIRGDAFMGCKSLISINAEHVTSIGVQGLRDCAALSELTIGACDLDMWVLYGCRNLKELTFTGTPDHIHNEAFRGSFLEHINVPWAEGQVAGAPWGADNAVIHYEYDDAYADPYFITNTLKLNILKEGSKFWLKGKTRFFDQETGLLVIDVEAELSENSTKCNVKKCLYWKDSTIYPIENEYNLSEAIKVKDGEPYILFKDLANVLGIKDKKSKGKYTLYDSSIEEGENETFLYEILSPEFCVKGYYNTSGILIRPENAEKYVIVENHIYTEKPIPVTSGDKFRMSFKQTSPSVADILFRDDTDDETGIKGIISNKDGAWTQRTNIIIEVPEGATRMFLSVYNNQVFSIERIHTTKRTDLSAITEAEFVNSYLSVLEENQKISHNMNYGYDFNRDGFPGDEKTMNYFTFIVDDTRPSIDQVAKVFLDRKVPLGVAGVPSIMIYTNSLKETNSVQTIREIINNKTSDNKPCGGELLAHEGTVIRRHNQYNADTMFNQFFKTKYRMRQMGFDVNGILLAGGAEFITGEESDLADRYVRNYYNYSDLYGKKEYKTEGSQKTLIPAPYHYGRILLSGKKAEKNLTEKEIKSKVRTTVDKAIDTNSGNRWSVFILHDFNDYSQMELEYMLDYILQERKDKIRIVNYSDIYNSNFLVKNPIQVKEIQAEANSDDNGKVYQHGDYFDTTQLKVNIVCQDGTIIEDFKDYCINYMDGNSLKAGDDIVTVYVPGPNSSPTIDVPVKVVEPEPKEDKGKIPDEAAAPSNYVSFNGQLSVNEKGQLINYHKKEFRLIGMSGGDTFFEFETVWHDDSLNVLKNDWHANCIRIFVMPYENYTGLPHYIGNEEEYYSKLKKLIDKFIDLDMYIDIVWAGEALNVSAADRFFDRLSQDYKNSPHMIYEVDNEPYTYTNAQIAAYARNIIRTIRRNSPNALIFVPVAGNNPSSLLDTDDKERLDKQYENVMYSYHQYMNGQTLVHIKDNLRPALEAKIPLVVTEWSSTDAGRVKRNEHHTYDEVLANNFVLELNNYNISWFYFCFAETPWEYGILHWEQGHTGNTIPWDIELKDDSLTESGKYIKALLSANSNVKDNTDAYAVLGQLGSNDGILEKNGIDRRWIKRIIFEKKNNTEEKSRINDGTVLDVSYLQNGGVEAYFTPAVDSGYDMHVTAKDTIHFPYYSINYFKGFSNMKSIEFDNINTAKVNTITNMFSECSGITELDLSLFEFGNIEYMRSTFANMTALTNIIFHKEGETINTEKLRAVNSLFLNDGALENLNLSGWSTGKITEMYDAFNHLQRLKALDLSGWKLRIDKSRPIITNVPKLDKLFLYGVAVSPEDIIYSENLIQNYTKDLMVYVAKESEKDLLREYVNEKQIIVHQKGDAAE